MRSTSSCETDWAQIAHPYDALLVACQSPVVALNFVVAMSMELVEELESGVRATDYRYVPAITAELLRRLGRTDDALLETAFELTPYEAERHPRRPGAWSSHAGRVTSRRETKLI